ncbi:MAG: YggS family pyridoxal phosphate-dependent enzyme [Planctomycetota bacterium]|nr:MAG: YggS family pyridoxal phosphate-dependent enzyme [Planctomycetota bacterium]
MSRRQAILTDNLHRVQSRIAAAAERAGRSPEEITLVAVTKYVSADVTRLIIEAGHHVLGESRPQQLCDKARALADLPVRWHLIGHLQRNKVRRTLPVVELIHSLDSIALLDTIERIAEEENLTVRGLLEVNISGNPNKHGFLADAVPEVVAGLGKYRRLHIEGLMCMGGWAGDLTGAAREFAALREMRDRLAADCPPPHQLVHLSMGMTNDFEIAIAEGATMVRIGSALFEGLDD